MYYSGKNNWDFNSSALYRILTSLIDTFRAWLFRMSWSRGNAPYTRRDVPPYQSTDTAQNRTEDPNSPIMAGTGPIVRILPVRGPLEPTIIATVRRVLNRKRLGNPSRKMERITILIEKSIPNHKHKRLKENLLWIRSRRQKQRNQAGPTDGFIVFLFLPH